MQIGNETCGKFIFEAEKHQCSRRANSAIKPPRLSQLTTHQSGDASTIPYIPTKLMRYSCARQTSPRIPLNSPHDSSPWPARPRDVPRCGCAIAQATTWQLLNFERRSTAFTCIDNVAFVGSPDAVHHDVRLFLERCRAVRATLNELTPLQIEDFLASSHTEQLASVTSWHKDAFTFLGVAYLRSAKTKSLSKKTFFWCFRVNDVPGHSRKGQFRLIFGLRAQKTMSQLCIK